ncbi:efflux RND transporter periplasmic adaptor subunit [Paenibacillus guangzhouensis]|uniref:efflux RND transporter periplasmic adaptor subunit n=1 Tax=Paenibacillus guangzhouensis TaxID=1473112 RepID=UPI001266E328|nr:efflux RND transporter periplasmic adaptor subunit [Paenibacillus guangzhouensis]
MKKKIGIVIISVVILGGLIFGYNLYAKGQKTEPVVQMSAKASRTDLVVKVSGTGTVSPVNQATVKSSDSGKIKSITFKTGQKVKKGQVLVTFEQDDMSSQVRKSELQIQQKQMDYDALKQKFMQASDEERDAMKTQIEQKKLDIEVAQLDLKDLQAKQKETADVVSPIDGTVVTSDIHVSDQVSPNTVLAEITDYDHLESVVQIDELDIGKVKTGQSVEMTLDAVADQVVQGKVTTVSQEGTAQNGVASFDVSIGLDKSDAIKVGMSLQADIIVEKKENAVVVPIEAVHQFGGKSYVQLASSGTQAQKGESAAAKDNTNNKFAPPEGNQPGSGGANTGRGARNAAMMQNMKEITVGIHNESYIEVLSGLNEGESVLLPAVAASKTGAVQMQGGFGGFGGMGGMGGGQGFRPEGGMGGGTRSTQRIGSGGGGTR